MARIRSIHPGLFTDEAFVTLSDAAQIFFLGLWTEADDQGVFEWKPVTLRMRLRPTKDGSVEALLAEIEAVDSIRRFELGGRHYGAIRNFRKYQRPKKPNSVHPITDEIRTYVALNTPSSELEGDEEASVPQKGEIAPQMEDGGGKRKDGRGRVDSAAVASQRVQDSEEEFRLEAEKPPLKPSKKAETFVIPGWVPAEPWAGYVEMRKKIKFPLTDYAMKLAIGKLDELRGQGHAPAAVLEHCILKNYRGIFPPPAGTAASSISNGSAAIPANLEALQAQEEALQRRNREEDHVH